MILCLYNIFPGWLTERVRRRERIIRTTIYGTSIHISADIIMCKSLFFDTVLNDTTNTRCYRRRHMMKYDIAIFHYFTSPPALQNPVRLFEIFASSDNGAFTVQ